MILKNVASQGIYLFAWNYLTNAPDTGDAANITGDVSKDGGAPAGFGTANPTEIGGGVYWQPLAQGETNCNNGACYWSSATAGVQVDPVFFATEDGTLSGNVPQTGDSYARIGATGSGLSSCQQAGSAVTLPANPPSGFIVAASIAASALNGKGDWLLASGYTAPDNADIAAIKTAVAGLTFTVGGKVDCNVLYVNGVQVTGVGTSGSPWGPA